MEKLPWDDFDLSTDSSVPTNLQYNPCSQSAMMKNPANRSVASRVPSPFKCPSNKPSQRNFHSNIYEQPPRSPSTSRSIAAHGNYAISSNNYPQPPRSPKITTTSYANEGHDDGDETASTPSYYQTPTSAGARSPKTTPLSAASSSSNESSAVDYLSSHGPRSPCPLSPQTKRRSPMSPRKFVFDAISPVVDHSSKKFEYYEPLSPDDGNIPGDYFEPHSPKLFEHRRNSSKKFQRGAIQKSKHEWNCPEAIAAGNELTLCGSPGLNMYLKRDSCVTQFTQLSSESNDTTSSGTSAVTTTTTISSSEKTRGCVTSGSSSGHIEAITIPKAHHDKRNVGRRHAINITSNPGYQVLHSSHSTLDRTCSDSVVSLRCRKSTSDLTAPDKADDIAMSSKSLRQKTTPSNSNSNSKARRRGSSKSGLALLASRRSSRESVKSACSNTSLFSNDDVGPLAFQASNRGRQRRTSNFLELPVPDHVRPRVCSLPDRPYNPRLSDDLYRLRHFSISKGNVVNCGDSIISRRSRSNTSVNSTNSRASERSPFDGSCCGGGYANVDSVPPSPVDDSDESDPPLPSRYRIVMLGDAGVGKTALVSQFMTSEYMHTYDASLDDEFGEKTVSVLLDDEESELVFIDHPSVEMSVENSLTTYEPHGSVVVFSVVDRSSFRVAEEIITYLWQENYTKDKSVILVGNKADLARARVISTQEGKSLAASRDAKFIETSSGIQHNVDELLVGTLKQIRLKESREKKAATSSKMKTSRTHISLHLAKELLQKICLSDIAKSKSCENLHVL